MSVTTSKMSTRVKSSSVESATVAYVTKYQDPEADIVLRSSDGVLFRVHSYHLKAASAFFRSMTTPATLGDSAVIDIDGFGLCVRRLLDQITLTTSPKIDHWSKVESILVLAERYQFDLLPRLLIPSIEPCLASHPYEVFAFASQHDFENLAKDAIRHFEKSSDVVSHPHPYRRDEKRVKLVTFDESALTGVSIAYFAALVRAMRASEGKDGFVSWVKAARIFEVKR